MLGQQQAIQVGVRCRRSDEEDESLIECTERTGQVTVRDARNEKKYKFERVFRPNSKQQEIYDELVEPMVKKVIDGFNCTVFALGQTGTGKTYKMDGTTQHKAASASNDVSRKDSEHVGIIPRAISKVFDVLNEID